MHNFFWPTLYCSVMLTSENISSQFLCVCRNHGGGRGERRLWGRRRRVIGEWLSCSHCGRQWQVCDWRNGSDIVTGDGAMQQSHWHSVRWPGASHVRVQVQLSVRRGHKRGNVLCSEHSHNCFFNGPLSGTTWVGQYQKKHSPTHTHSDHRTSFINFLHLVRSIACSLCALSSLTLNSLDVLECWHSVVLTFIHLPIL